MCNPALAVGVASTLGGAVLKDRAAKKGERMSAGAIADFNRDNLALETAARSGMQDVVNRFSPTSFDAGQANETARLQDLFLDAASLTQPAATPMMGPRIVADTIASEAAKANAFNAQQAQALAQIQGFGDFLANRINPQLSDSANTIAMTGNMMRGNATPLNAQLRNAQRASQSPLGELLQAGGTVGTQYGLFKG